MAYLFCFCYVWRNVGNPLMELRILYITIINTSNYSCYYCCWCTLRHGKYLIPCNFIERDIPWIQLSFVGKSFLFIQNTLEAYQDGADPNIALIRINDTTENQKYVLYYAMKTEQRENPEVNLLIVGGKSSQDICKLKIIFGYFLLFGRMVLSVIDSYYTCSMYSTMTHTL